MKINKLNYDFWTAGNGRDFIEWVGKDVLPKSYDIDIFYQFDKETDMLVDKWLKSGYFKTIMKSLHRGTDEDLPEDYLQYKKKFRTKT